MEKSRWKPNGHMSPYRCCYLPGNPAYKEFIDRAGNHVQAPGKGEVHEVREALVVSGLFWRTGFCIIGVSVVNRETGNRSNDAGGRLFLEPVEPDQLNLMISTR